MLGPFFMECISYKYNIFYLCLHPCRTITCWRCVSTAPPAGPTQTARSGTVLIWSAQSENTADTRTDQQSYMTREYNTDSVTPSLNTLFFHREGKSPEACCRSPPCAFFMCVCWRVGWEAPHQGFSVLSPPCPAS